MKLIKLSSSLEKFKTVEFNENGFTVILAENKMQEDLKAKSSLNGVGKSLIVYLIHFCLGSKVNNDLKNKLPNEYFQLDFKIGDQLFQAKRFTSDQDFIYLNEEKLKVHKFNDKVEKLVFPDCNVKFVTFRNLISRFIRPFSYSYAIWGRWVPKEDKVEHTPYLNTLYLLGVDPEIINKKFELKEKLKNYDSKLKSFKKDPILLEYFKDKNKDIDIDIETLKNIISNKKEKLNKFNFSEEYYALETKAKDLAIEIRQLNNKRILLTNTLELIKNSMKLEFNKDSELVIETYDLLREIILPDKLKNIQEVMEFHNSLLSNRKKRLAEQKKLTEKEIIYLQEKIENLSKEHNRHLALLDKNAPFEQGMAIKEEINNLEQKLNHLQEYDEIINKYKTKLSETGEEIIEQNKIADEYLKEIKELRINLDTKFKELSETFYGKKEAYVTIKNNEANNTIRFNLNVKIDDDSSDGVREIELFCFDIMLFLMRKNTNVDFLFHDSRLFGNVDPSQMRIAFEIIRNMLNLKDFQYIVSLNKNQYENIREEFKKLGKEEIFNEIFNDKNIKLRLGKKDEEKLLGFQKDINYDIS